jgi:ElaB/YqjD/DUF883 family membrane-anchored ribosome-binding protein
MSNAGTTNTEMTSLRDDVQALKHDVTSLLEHLKTEVTNGAQCAASHLDDGSRRLYRGVSTEGGRAAKALGQQIEKQPLLAALIALGLGYLGGRLLSR